MSKFKYFAEVNGQTIEFARVDYRPIDPKKPYGPNAIASFGYVKGTGWVKVDRKVEYKSNPSRHICDARCMNATGKNMICECSCGGKNHGKGYRCE